ncbi:unnamed protein product [Cladocopium goreaui]|uniref:Peridinin-chlorophyll a-binding protein, chloroplastic (PCP) n=1 Tax=Cladocopium goreaui TaxID=2562237 RepID=A0A9P1DEK5_9DINO|nr:unnamed protein product [Cladocopium goreaui]
MVRGARKALAVGVAVAVACGLQKHLNFVPGPRHAAPVAAAAASMMMAPAAFADEIGDAAKKLGDASYSFAKEVDWNNGIFLQAPGKFQPLEALKAIDKMIEMGAAADPKLLKDAAEAHHKAIGSISGPNGVTSRADWDAVNAAIGRVVASVPKAKVMAVYDSVNAITDPGVPAYMKSLVNGPDAEKAYQGFLEFKDVVEKNQVATAGAPAVVPSGDKIGEAAKALSDASYPFIKDIDWLSDIYLKPLPGKTAPETLKAIDKMIVMGAKMDGNLLKAAAEAHHKAIGSIDATGVTSAADYEAVNAAIGHLVASVPKTTVMDVYNSMAGVVDSSVPNNLFSKVNPLDAVAAAKGFYTFKDVVDWFSVRKTTGVERLSRWLRAREIAVVGSSGVQSLWRSSCVVVFELDDVMCCRSRGDRGVSLFQLEDYFAGISQDFAEVAPALARRGYFLAVVIRGFHPANREEKSSPSRWWRKEVAEEAKDEFVDGPELARKLIARRCPDALPSFQAISTTQDRKVDGSSLEDAMQQIAKEYRVPARRMVLFTASNAFEQDGQDKTWTGIHVPNPKEGFRHDDYQLPTSLDEGYLTLLPAVLEQAWGFVAKRL